MTLITASSDGIHCSGPLLSIALVWHYMQTTLLHTGIKPGLLFHELQWQNATQSFDSSVKIPQDKFDILLESLRLAPSSMGLQPWKFIVVKNKTVRRELKKYALPSAPLTHASHLIVLCALKRIDEAYIDELIKKEKELREDKFSALEEVRTYALALVDNLSKEELRNWMTEQVYTALGFLLSACSLLCIDACPIENINQAKFDKILSCSHFGIETRIAVAIGYHSDHDKQAGRIKAALAKEEVVITI